jgi:hypothetical protein
MGCCPAKYLKRRAERHAFEEEELTRAIPDYDPAEAKSIAEARSGRMLPLSEPGRMAPNTVRKVPRKAARKDG